MGHRHRVITIMEAMKIRQEALEFAWCNNHSIKGIPVSE